LKETFAPSLSKSKEFEGLEGIILPSVNRESGIISTDRGSLISQNTIDFHGSRSARLWERKALHMNGHRWMCRQLIALGGIALAFAPISTLGETLSKHPKGWTATGAERVLSLNLSSEQSSGEGQQATAQTQPRLSNGTVAEQALPKPPQVTYEDGRLTIIAENSSLSDVMKALREALGADVDLPPSVASQRIWVRLGPGPARSVLRDLLDGTEFNYVIQAEEDDALAIRSISLTPRSKSANPEQNPGLPERAANRRIPRGGPEAKDAAGSEEPVPPESVASTDSSQASASAPPTNQLAAANSPDAANSSGSGNGSPETDRMIQQLQSMYEQRRQIQLQQNQKPPARNQ